MGGWDGDWSSPDEQEAARAAQLEAAQRAKLSQFERRVVDSLAELVDVVGRRQPAAPVCAYCGTEQPIAGEPEVMRYDDRLEQAARTLERAFPTLKEDFTLDFWRKVAGLVAMQLFGKARAAEGDVSDASAEPDGLDPGSARPEDPEAELAAASDRLDNATDDYRRALKRHDDAAGHKDSE